MEQQQWRIPAFGEWNCDGHYGVPVYGWAPVTPCFDVVAAVRKTPNISFPERKHFERARASGQARRRRIPAFGEWNHDDSNGNVNNGWPAAATTPFFDLAAEHKPAQTETRDGSGVAAEAKRRPAEAHPHGRRRSKVADASEYAARKACFTVVAAPKAVDDDLYGVPFDMLRRKPARRRGWLRRILMTAGYFCPRGGTGTCMA